MSRPVSCNLFPDCRIKFYTGWSFAVGNPYAAMRRKIISTTDDFSFFKQKK